METVCLIIIFILSAFVGYFVIWGITPSLHSPLMSVSNAISGIIIIGAMISYESAQALEAETLAFLAILFAAINIFGGFALSERMLTMFHKKSHVKKDKK